MRISLLLSRRTLPALLVLVAAAGCRHDWDSVTITGNARDASPNEEVGTSDDAGPVDAPDAAVDLPSDLLSDDGSDDADKGGACDPTETPNDVEGVFVSPTGSAAGAGTRASPLLTIKAAQAAALAAGTLIIYLDAGTYAEEITVGANFANGISFIAGWTVTGTSWARNCAAGRRDQTIVASPVATGASLSAVTGAIVLRDFTITTEAQGAVTATGDAETVIGLWLRSDGHVTLTNVHIIAGAGGPGPVQPAPGAAGNATCSGLTDCSGGAGGTTPAAGAAGPAGNVVGGLFVPGDAVAGGPGTMGQNGSAGAAGKSGACLTSCTGNAAACAIDTCAAGTTTTSSGGGTCGCAGLGGAAGPAGMGGGASFGLLAHGSAVVVDAHNSLIEAGVGGDGSAGGLGGVGGPGTTGMVGAAISCPTGTCQGKLSSSVCTCTLTSNGAMLAGGSAGGNGGKGGDGSPGGGGAGGWSVSVITSVGAQVNPDGMTTLKHAAPGGGKGGAMNGQSGDIIAVQ